MTKPDQISKKINDIVSLSGKKVSVGVPADNNSREDGAIGNAALAAIHNNGSPLQNIPARPFMDLGIKKTQDQINDLFLAAAKAQLNDDPALCISKLDKAGQIARDEMKNILTTSEGLAPLTRETLLRRTRKLKYLWKLTKEQRETFGESGISLRSKEGKTLKRSMMNSNREAIMASLYPLVDTGALRSSINYVLTDIPPAKINIPVINSDRQSKDVKGKAFEGMMIKQSIERGAGMAKRISEEFGNLLK